MKNIRLYSKLSKIYKIIARPEDYIKDTEYYCKVMLDEGFDDGNKILHFGCGSGCNDYTLKKHYNVTGIDISQKMIGLAKKINPEVKYIKGDIRTIRLKDEFDIVLAYYESIEYMKEKADLIKALKTAYYHLKKNGLLFLIIGQTKENFVQNETRTSLFKEDDTEVTFIENFYDPEIEDSSFEATYIFIVRSNGKTNNYVDIHQVGIFTIETWREVLLDTGFQIKVKENELNSEYSIILCYKE